MPAPCPASAEAAPVSGLPGPKNSTTPGATLPVRPPRLKASPNSNAPGCTCRIAGWLKAGTAFSGVAWGFLPALTVKIANTTTMAATATNIPAAPRTVRHHTG